MFTWHGWGMNSFLTSIFSIDSGNYVWRVKSACTTTPWTLSVWASLGGDEGSPVYIASTMNSAELVFRQLNSTDGTEIGAKYRYSVTWTESKLIQT